MLKRYAWHCGLCAEATQLALVTEAEGVVVCCVVCVRKVCISDSGERCFTKSTER